MADQTYQSLYRRYRPQKFHEVRGQDHVVRALQNAVRQDHVGHAYLFSGPRGTGKTSTARILAKALNCTNLSDGEPCGTCDSCLQIEQGSSLDVHELDAASNNGVEAMRDLISRAALGTPGRWKVYIVDEVHMLSTAASNSLLKTLEEPPSHVVFVLATTDPQKVLPTIRSRTQHFEFRLLQSDVLRELLNDVNGAAVLGVPPEAIDLVVRKGSGSARDALSVLDQVAAAGVVEDEVSIINELVDALSERDAGRVLVAVEQGVSSGRDPRRLAADLLDHLRDGFLATMSKGLVTLPDVALEEVEEQARRLGSAALVRTMETLGQALIDMRDAIDPRVILEVALVRVARPEADVSPAALLERIERLERKATAPQPLAAVRAPAEDRQTAGPARPRAALGSLKREAPQVDSASADTSATAPTSATQTSATHTSAAGGSVSQVRGEMPSRDELTKAWGDQILENLPQRARARFRVGRFTDAEPGLAVFCLPNEIHRERCDEVRPEVEQALSAYFGTKIKMKLMVEGPVPALVDNSAVTSARDDDDVNIGLDELVEAPTAVASVEQRLKEVFPGAEEIS